MRNGLVHAAVASCLAAGTARVHTSAPAAFKAGTADPPRTEAAPVRLREIVVTAMRRAQNLQNVCSSHRIRTANVRSNPASRGHDVVFLRRPSRALGFDSIRRDGLCVIALELTEPSLFFAQTPGAAGRLARLCSQLCANPTRCRQGPR